MCCTECGQEFVQDYEEEVCLDCQIEEMLAMGIVYNEYDYEEDGNGAF